MMKTLALFIFTVTSIFYLIYWYIKRKHNYWKDRQVPYIEPVFFYGNIKSEICNRKPWHNFSSDCYNKFKSNGFGGVYFLTAPILYVCDLKLIEKVLIEDFQYFQDRWLPDETLSSSLTFGRGEHWRNKRLKLASAFANNKIKGMFQQMLTAADHTLAKLNNQVEQVEIESLATTFSTEVIASCLFGIDMAESYESIQLRKSLEQINLTVKKKSILMILVMIYPKSLNLFKIDKAFRIASESISNVIKDMILIRVENRANRRNDILQVMLDWQFQTEESEKDQTSQNLKPTTQLKDLEGCSFTYSDIAMLMYNFLSSGIKPTAVTITFALYELASNPEIQKNVQQDIDSSLAKNNGWNSKSLEHMTYLDQVIQETLRLHSFNGALIRVLSKSYILPGTSVALEKNTQIIVPIDAIHKDPEFYPDPLEFRPGRFEGHHYKPTATWLPFGQGPRICVAIRLAVTMVKLCLARILAQYEVKISDKMQLPLELSDSDFYPRAKGGMWLDFVKRENSS